MKMDVMLTPLVALVVSRTLFQRIATILLPFILAACATTGTAQNTPTREDGRARLATAEAMFAERCKKAGVFIHRTAENIEVIFLMKIRPKGINYGDQYALDDPYGSDHGGDAYIRSFLRGNYADNRPEKPTAQTPPRNAYRYVEALDPNDGNRYRYTGSIKEVTHSTSILMGGDGKTTFKTKDFVLDKLPAPGPTPRYGVTYDDISTREDRDHWIAGSSLRVIDLATNEVMAERIGYMVDRGQGDRGGGRSPWLFAADNACPPFGSRYGAAAQTNQTEKFVETVLKPTDLEK
jgi:hypothetical protein